MFETAYHELHTLEGSHWWFRGARAVYRTLLLIGFGKPNGETRMLEVGSGSGGNLLLLSDYGPTVGVEVSWTGLSLTPVRPILGLVQARAEALPFRHNAFNGIHLLGVIEHLDDDERALKEAARVCCPDGAITILTSALPVLWSHHDEANLHKRRYIRRELKRKICEAGCIPLRISYENFFTFLPTLFSRLWQRRAGRTPRYDMGKPPSVLNSFLTYLLFFEAWLIRYLELPIGVDLVAVCRPKKSV
jgi:SAM-dependent methyltransferase